MLNNNDNSKSPIRDNNNKSPLKVIVTSNNTNNDKSPLKVLEKKSPLKFLQDKCQNKNNENDLSKSPVNYKSKLNIQIEDKENYNSNYNTTHTSNNSNINNENDEMKKNMVNKMVKKLYNKSPSKINVKRNFMITQMGEDTFKFAIKYLQKCEDPLESIKKKDKELFINEEMNNYADFLYN